MLPGLYAHAPFCQRRCPYCDFYSDTDLTLIPLWLTALKQEAALRFPYWTDSFDTLYLGGGSPSLLNRQQLTSFKEALGPLKISPKAEVTIEANPEDVTAEIVRGWVSVGVTRVSLGVQSFLEKALTGPLGRTARRDMSLSAIKIIRGSGLSLSLDLLFAWPGQDIEDWLDDLAWAGDSGAEHLSLYALYPPVGSPIAQSLKLGQYRPVAEDLEAEMFLTAGCYLKRRGYERYEVANFAKRGAQCRHNLKYWRRDNYLGLGPAAHSFDGTRRWANVSSITEWAKALSEGRTSLSLIEDVSPEQARLESLMLGLRLAQGAPLSLAKDQRLVDKLTADGYLIKTGGYMKPTEKGFLAADFLARFLA
ncbi:MAG: radical SAM family heme chaperone HemW [Deltaproteobacteria bacterium]|jgi:oxygen-independent coproporphyrinogen-3 oxidase|nr:radical SAM family heme chaperone HemW [Deltaproteobacteria bacterium]